MGSLTSFLSNEHLFNSLSPEIQNASSIAVFTSKLKSFFVVKAYNGTSFLLVCTFSLLSVFCFFFFFSILS